MREKISEVFLEVFKREVPETDPPALSDDLILLESGLDSLGFAVLIVELENRLGFDPFSLANEAFYPRTFREFVEFYEKHKP